MQPRGLSRDRFFVAGMVLAMLTISFVIFRM
jgi:hypothetical protein